MGNAIKIGGGGSTDIVNGVIKEYLASTGTIDAGSFVEFVNQGTGTWGSDTAISTTSSAGYVISAVLLPNGNVFIAHSHLYDYSYYLYGVICTISGTIITVGTDTAINSSITNAGYAISAVLLPNGNVFIAHSYGDSIYLYGVICTISGRTITVGTDTAINSSIPSTGYTISAVLLPNGNVFIAHKYGSSHYLYGVICTISGRTITVGTDTAINSSIKNTGQQISAVLLPNGNVFIAHKYGDRAYLYGVICTISGTIITVGTDTAINASITNAGYAISAVLLPNGNVFIAHSYGDSIYLYGVVCTISGRTITVGTDTAINSSITNIGYRISTVVLPNGNVFIAYSYDNSIYLYGVICTISGRTITVGTDTAINASITTNTGAGISAIVLSTGIFIAHNQSQSYLYGIVQPFHIQASTTTINGVTTSKATTTTAAKTWVLSS